MDTLKSTLQAVHTRIEQAVVRAGRNHDEVLLLAVSKTASADAVRALADCGQRDFGENYVQEALDKMAQLADRSLVWHFIGPIQRNKTALIATHFDWVHSVDRLLIAQRLSAARPEQRGALNICLQVNVSAEASKGGVTPAELPLLARQVAHLPNIRLRGLMAIPRATDNLQVQHEQFAAVRACLQALNRDGATLDTLSMGMSGDLEAAIAEGATIVRVGSALFGARSPRRTEHDNGMMR